VPAVAETPGLAGFETDLWYGMLAPAKMNPRVVDKLYTETRKILFQPELRNRYEPTGTQMVGSTPAQFAATIKKDLVKWGEVIKTANIKLE